MIRTAAGHALPPAITGVVALVILACLLIVGTVLVLDRRSAAKRRDLDTDVER